MEDKAQEKQEKIAEFLSQIDDETGTVSRYVESLGYRKPLDRPGLREKITEILDSGISIGEMADKILALLDKLEKPPVSDATGEGE